MSTLTDVTNEQRDRLMAHVEGLPALAEEIRHGVDAEVAARFSSEYDFLVNALVPHMASVETTLYPELDRLLSCRLAMTPMAREHERIRELVAHLGRLGMTDDAAENEQRTEELSRTLHQLHDVVEPHLREESRYVPLLEHNLGSSAVEALAVATDDGFREAR